MGPGVKIDTNRLRPTTPRLTALRRSRRLRTVAFPRWAARRTPTTWLGFDVADADGRDHRQRPRSGHPARLGAASGCAARPSSCGGSPATSSASWSSSPGMTVLAAGVLMLVLPGPGVLIIIAGLAILATEFVWAERAMNATLARASKVSGAVTGNTTGRDRPARSRRSFLHRRRRRGLPRWSTCGRMVGLTLVLAGVRGPGRAPPGIQRWLASKQATSPPPLWRLGGPPAAFRPTNHLPAEDRRSAHPGGEGAERLARRGELLSSGAFVPCVRAPWLRSKGGVDDGEPETREGRRGRRGEGALRAQPTPRCSPSTAG